MISARSYLKQTNARIDGLRADFSGMEKLEEVIGKVLHRLETQASVKQMANMQTQGAVSLETFDGWLSELVRVELGKTLAVIRAKAVKKARDAGAGSAQTAVLRRMYKSGQEGNVNIADQRKRISSRERIVPAPNGGKSGIRRPRTVKPRTKQLREYYGPDRAFILRILENGRDVYYAKPKGPSGRGSRATYGKRGSITPRHWFFHAMKSDMEQAAQQLGETLVGHVEEWMNQEFGEFKD